MKNIILADFSDEKDFLSNYYEVTFIYEGITYPTSEHAYQAAKKAIAEKLCNLNLKKEQGNELGK